MSRAQSVLIQAEKKGGLFKATVSQIATRFNSLFYFLSNEEAWIGRIYRMHCTGIHCILKLLNAFLKMIRMDINDMQLVYNFQ